MKTTNTTNYKRRPTELVPIRLLRDGIIPEQQRIFARDFYEQKEVHTFQKFEDLHENFNPRNPAYFWTHFTGTQEEYYALPKDKQKEFRSKFVKLQVRIMNIPTFPVRTKTGISYVLDDRNKTPLRKFHNDLANDFNSVCIWKT